MFQKLFSASLAKCLAPMSYQHYRNLRLVRDNKGRFFIEFNILNKRYRFSNTRAINTNLSPNIHAYKNRRSLAVEMLKCFKEELDKGWTPNKTNKNTTLHNATTSFEPNKRLTEKYLTELKRTTNQLTQFFPPDAYLRNIDHTHLTNYLTKTTNTASCFNHERARISSVLGAAYNEAKLPNPCLHIKPKKVKPTLHKPFKDVCAVLRISSPLMRIYSSVAS